MDKNFDILACISDSYLRLTTAHTQAKKSIYSISPHLPLKVVIGWIKIIIRDVYPGSATI
jgi:hypothetical protein